jgi:alpha-L-fucosidase 2
VIRLFPAWPPEWDARFTLRARGAFVVSASQKSGRVESVELRSEAGAVCRLHNPWGTRAVTIVRNGRTWKQLKGPLLTFDTLRGDVLVLKP